MASVKTWILETRPSFLLLVPVCVFAGVAVSIYEGYSFNAVYFVLAFVGALFAHISANVFNEYFDFKSGIDLNTQRTPAFVGALFAHISANVFNEYFDFKSGIDLNTQRTPFSGGSGILPAALLRPKQVLWVDNINNRTFRFICDCFIYTLSN